MTLVGAVATHYHPDHIGGTFIGEQHVSGIVELLALQDVPVHVQADEVSWVLERTGVDPNALLTHQDGEVLNVGGIEITLLHTPGHTPGSQCLFVEGCLLSGDTLFIDGCGRTDFPGGDPEEMYWTLSERLAQVSDETVLYPGHLYSKEPYLTMGEVRARNAVFAATSLEQWLVMFGT
jgi:glyoxylase-like metal-dependent hydrolase (beta-lactamase superfamily II)